MELEKLEKERIARIDVNFKFSEKEVKQNLQIIKLKKKMNVI